MLLDEQAAELLKRCEKIVGSELSQIRGSLKKSENRAAFVWELLVLEAASKIGTIEYEPRSGGSPDIRLQLPNGRKIWIEIAYLYPRFWKKERESFEVTRWIYAEAERRGVPSHKIYPRLDGKKQNHAGPVRALPKINERKKFLKSPDIIEFFENIKLGAESKHFCEVSGYTISITYNPKAQGPYLSSGGLVQEAPTKIEEHAIYRVLKEKSKQHSVNAPRIICVGSDQSPALSSVVGPMQITVRDAIQAIFFKNQTVSATIIVTIENVHTMFGRFEKQARGEIFTNETAKNPLMPEEVNEISRMDFNQWKYSQPLNKWKETGANTFPRVTGKLTWRPGPMSMEVEIPANIVIDALAGKTTLAKSFDVKEDTSLYQAFNEGWEVESCSFKKGNIQLGEAPKVVLKLTPPFPAYESPKKKKSLNQ